MYCDRCDSNVPVALKTCPTCGVSFADDKVSNVLSASTKETIAELKNKIFIPAPFDEDIVPSKTRTKCVDLNWDLGLHNIISKFIIGLFALVNLILGIIFVNGQISFVDDSKVFASIAHVGDLRFVTRIFGVSEQSRYGMELLIRFFGIVLIIAALSMLLTLVPMIKRRARAPQGFKSALEVLFVTKIIAGVVAVIFTQFTVFVVFGLLLAIPDIVMFIIANEYYKERMHMFR